jgi:hypothetical protein
MAKWYGRVGYVTTVETEPGIYEPEATERTYYGDLLKNVSKWAPSTTSINDNLNVANQISIVADPYAYQHFSSIKYVEFMDAMWEVTSAEPQYPRIILTVGGVYNGPQAGTADET